MKILNYLGGYAPQISTYFNERRKGAALTSGREEVGREVVTPRG